MLSIASVVSVQLLNDFNAFCCFATSPRVPQQQAASQVSVSHPKHQQALSLPPLPPPLSFPLQSPTLGSPWVVTTCPSDIRNLTFGRFLQKQEATHPDLQPLSKLNISDLSKCHVAIMIAHNNQFCQ